MGRHLAKSIASGDLPPRLHSRMPLPPQVGLMIVSRLSFPKYFPTSSRFCLLAVDEDATESVLRYCVQPVCQGDLATVTQICVMSFFRLLLLTSDPGDAILGSDAFPSSSRRSHHPLAGHPRFAHSENPRARSPSRTRYSAFRPAPIGRTVFVDHGSLYLALQRLEAKKWISAKWDLSENNRKALLFADS
jgi:Transcriptional regulator PadR-like family